MNADAPHILLINPWIFDFAAYDFWARPLGLLGLAAMLRQEGLRITYMDLTDRFHPRMQPSAPAKRQGRGPYLKTRLPKPPGFEDLPRHYSRYGIRPEWFLADLQAAKPPDLILVTSMMTYWYPGVKAAIACVRRVYPDVPIVLGGIYATLCPEHARAVCGADQVVSGSAPASIKDVITAYTGYEMKSDMAPDLDRRPYPAFDLQHQIPFVALLTSLGCPYDCQYCASNFLQPRFVRRSPEAVAAEIFFWAQKYGVQDFVFYDDALLVASETHILPLLEAVIKQGLRVRFHTPNALHIREITPQTAGMMYRAGFKTIRLGLETATFEDRRALDRKVTAEEFQRAVQSLRQAGFERRQIGAYLLVGLPGQEPDQVLEAIELVRKSGVTPVPAYFTPIPHTALWDRAKAASRYDIASDPLFTNNAALPCWPGGFSWEFMETLKAACIADP